MKRFFTLILFVVACLGTTDVVAQSRTSYFMEGSYFRTELNPALVPTRGYLALPIISGIGYNDSSNFNSLENGYFYKDGKYVPGMDSSVSAYEFLSRLPNELRRETSYNVNLFGLGFYANRTFLSFGVNGRMYSDMTLPKSMVSYLKSPDGSLFEESASAVGSAFLDVYFGSSFRVSDYVNIGVKAKFLVGIIDLGVDVESMMATSGSSDIVDMLRGQWRFNCGVLDNKYVTPDGEYDGGEEHDGSAVDILRNINSYGAAIDLGTEVRLCDDHLRLSLAVTDLGLIRWDGSSHLVGDIVVGDDDSTGGYVRVPEKPGYTTMLNGSLNAGVEYAILRNHISFGLLSHTKFCKESLYSELTASINLRPANWLSLTVSHTFFNGNRPGIFGAAINIHPAAINIYAGVDFIDTKYVLNYDLPRMSDSDVVGYPPAYMAKRATSVNAYVGIAINFGRPQHVKLEQLFR